MWGVHHHVARGALVAAALAALMTTAGCTPKPVGNPDPGHRLLNAIRPVPTAVPKGLHVTRSRSYKPRWDSCDGIKSTYGWDDITVETDFTGGTKKQVVAQVGAGMRALGWVPDPDRTGDGSWDWEKTLPGGGEATAELSTLDDAGPPTAPIDWSLDGNAPPATHPVSGC